MARLRALKDRFAPWQRVYRHNGWYVVLSRLGSLGDPGRWEVEYSRDRPNGRVGLAYFPSKRKARRFIGTVVGG